MPRSIQDNTIDVTFSDHTHRTYQSQGTPEVFDKITLANLLDFRSSDSSVLSVSGVGRMTLNKNTPKDARVTITAVAKFPVGSGGGASVSKHVYVNLDPGPLDVDLGRRHGPMFQDRSEGDAFDVDVRMHTRH